MFKNILSISVISFALIGCSQSDSTPTAESAAKEAAPAKAAPVAAVPAAMTDLKVEVGCGKCIYGMKGVNGCVTAAKVNGVPMLVSGVNTDAHAYGLCGTSKQATISGKIEGEKLVLTQLNVQ